MPVFDSGFFRRAEADAGVKLEGSRGWGCRRAARDLGLSQARRRLGGGL